MSAHHDEESLAAGERVVSAIQKLRTYRAIFDAIPHPLFIVDTDVRIQDCNERALELLRRSREQVLSIRGGEVLDCLRHTQSPGGCGTHHACRTCGVRSSVSAAITGSDVARRYTRMSLRKGDQVATVDFLVSTKRLSDTEAMLMLEEVNDLLALSERISRLHAA